MFLQAAAIAAAAGIAVGNHRDVAQFARHAQIALQYSAAGNDAAANARAERQQYQIVHVASGAHPFFAQRGGIGIVFQNDVRAEAAFDFGADGEILQAGEVIRVADDAFLQQYETGDADADARQPGRTARVAQFRDGVDHMAQHGFAPGGGIGGRGAPVEDMAVAVYSCCPQVGTTQIEAN